MSQLQADELIKTLIGYAYPSAEPVGKSGRRFVRRWVARSERELPDQAALDALAERLVTEATRVLREAYGQTSEDQLRDSLPMASIVRIAPNHCVVVIESPTPGHAVGDAAAVGTWRILRGMDNAIGIEDLEGIPKRFWFPMR